MWLSVPCSEYPSRENLRSTFSDSEYIFGAGVHRIQGKCGYMCLPYSNALARMAVCSWLSVPYSLLLHRMAGCSVQPRKCGDSGYGICSRTCGYTELSELRPGYPKCPTPNIGTIRGPALYKILLRLEQYRSSTSDRQINQVREKYLICETFCIVWRCYNRVVSIAEWRNNYWEKWKREA